jgi:hypothetical protein
MDEDGKKMSGPVARRAVLFRKAVLKGRRREQPAARGTVAAASPEIARDARGTRDTSGTKGNGVKALQMRIRAAFGDADAA